MNAALPIASPSNFFDEAAFADLFLLDVTGACVRDLSKGNV
jgi:hypothetical protein